MSGRLGGLRRLLAGIRPRRAPAVLPSSDLDDVWREEDYVWHRDRLSFQWLSGEGLEIGALHHPLLVNPGVRVRYVDYKTLAENRLRYPELKDHEIVETDIVEDGFVLESVASGSINFIIANHALEHSPDPYGTLLVWKSKLAPGGALFLAVPIADRCYDQGRPITTLEHLLEDHTGFGACDVDRVLATTREHLSEFMRISGATIRRGDGEPPLSEEETVARIEDLMGSVTERIDRNNVTYAALMSAHILGLNRRYDVHYHTFSPASYQAFLAEFGRREGLSLLEIRKSGGGECIGILRVDEG